MFNLGTWEWVLMLLLCVIPLLTAVFVGMGGIRVYRSKTRHCPYCAERIRNEAKLCRHCGKEVQPIIAQHGNPD